MQTMPAWVCRAGVSCAQHSSAARAGRASSAGGGSCPTCSLDRGPCWLQSFPWPSQQRSAGGGRAEWCVSVGRKALTPSQPSAGGCLSSAAFTCLSAPWCFPDQNSLFLRPACSPPSSHLWFLHFRSLVPIWRGTQCFKWRSMNWCSWAAYHQPRSICHKWGTPPKAAMCHEMTLSSTDNSGR